MSDSNPLDGLLQSTDELYGDSTPTTTSRVQIKTLNGHIVKLPYHPLSLLTRADSQVNEAQVKAAMAIIEQYPIPEPEFDKPNLEVVSLLAYLCKAPTATLTNIALYFKVSVGTIRSIVSSDLFNAAINEMKLKISTELLVDVQNEILAGVKTATEQINAQMLAKPNSEFALRAVKTLGKLAGLGAPTVNITPNSPAINITNHIQLAKATYDAKRNQPAPVELRAELCSESGQQISNESPN